MSGQYEPMRPQHLEQHDEQQEQQQAGEFRVPRQRPRRALRLVVGASAAVLLAGGGALVGAGLAGQGAQAESSQTSMRTQGRQLPGSGPLYGGRGGGQQAGGSQETGSQQAASSQLTGLVRIQTVVDYGEGEAAGTGMVLTSGGEVVTNHHVVAGATKIRATVMSTGRTYTAEVVGTDSTDDVAVLRLQDASGLDTIRADTDGLSVGDQVTAVGDAEGAKTLSQAAGTVSALGRSITTSSEGTTQGERLRGLIEIDADVISGDSGGATYDGEGEVVGMTTAASSGSADVTGYAIPIAKVLSIAGDLVDDVQSSDYTYGYPAFLGVALGQQGTTLQGVYDGSAADDAGLAAGDTVTAVDGQQVSSAAALSKAVAAHDPGDRVQVSWTDADGSQDSATVTLGQGPVA